MKEADVDVSLVVLQNIVDSYMSYVMTHMEALIAVQCYNRSVEAGYQITPHDNHKHASMPKTGNVRINNCRNGRSYQGQDTPIKNLN